MTHRIAINGYGRIGRSFLRALQESGLREQLAVVHINEPADLDSIAYLTRFDSTHGRFPGKVERHGDGLLIDDAQISVSHATLPHNVDWKALGIDLMIECSGQYGQRGELDAFLDAGVARLLLSHPGHSASDVDATIVYGINHGTLTGTERLVSNASCTTNAVVPVLDLLDREFGVEQVFLSTLHSVMNDQPLLDGYHHSDLRRTRSAMQSMIPISTGLARGVERLLPQLMGRVQAKAIRVPTLNVSAIDLVVHLKKRVDASTVNRLLADAAAGPWAKLIAYSETPHASIDFNHDPHSAIVDGSQTLAAGDRLINLLVWFDNEWGFANRMLDVAKHWLGKIGC
ncbi:glyceraldehyde 3-phosphate dehydrogenase NAD-binding domain-containing protein [Rhodoferax ferrireducens]|uniref:type I glyceraldehyde-3-phosphate dehydrogenase n=1 Tax=Rhodoferax ferrireducens TaxID=192843 RepID=UPI00298DD4A9|nr:glyceraldehyde 3-phosphate dehydrogenase NAD-binding domain-containing protein [Rhodoferax ferrireducens]WPC67893.1 glyceraldehyde 3-phosphate dehydrogenase NAD-binding domain-containing protein [Rhodoferax ferrireducens]